MLVCVFDQTHVERAVILKWLLAGRKSYKQTHRRDAEAFGGYHEEMSEQTDHADYLAGGLPRHKKIDICRGSSSSSGENNTQTIDR